jgi:hypothetical protein
MNDDDQESVDESVTNMIVEITPPGVIEQVVEDQNSVALTSPRKEIVDGDLPNESPTMI